MVLKRFFSSICAICMTISASAAVLPEKVFWNAAAASAEELNWKKSYSDNTDIFQSSKDERFHHITDGQEVYSFYHQGDEDTNGERYRINRASVSADKYAAQLSDIHANSLREDKTGRSYHSGKSSVQMSMRKWEETSYTPSDDQNIELYRDILDLCYNNTANSWEGYYGSAMYGIINLPQNHALSPMWYSEFMKTENTDSLSDTGYQFIDINEDGTDELILGVQNSANEIQILDVFTAYDNSIVHLVSGSSRIQLQIGSDHEIIITSTELGDGQYEKTNSYQNTYCYIQNGKLVPFEAYRHTEWTDGFTGKTKKFVGMSQTIIPYCYYSDPIMDTLTQDPPSFIRTPQTSFSNKKEITESEYYSDKHNDQDIQLIPFSNYSLDPQLIDDALTYEDIYGDFIYSGAREMLCPYSGYAGFEYVHFLKGYYLDDIDGDQIKELIVDFCVGGSDETFRICYGYKNGSIMCVDSFDDIYLIPECWLAADGKGVIVISAFQPDRNTFGRWDPFSDKAGTDYGIPEELGEFQVDYWILGEGLKSMPDVMKPYCGRQLVWHQVDDLSPLEEQLPDQNNESGGISSLSDDANDSFIQEHLDLAQNDPEFVYTPSAFKTVDKLIEFDATDGQLACSKYYHAVGDLLTFDYVSAFKNVFNANFTNAEVEEAMYFMLFAQLINNTDDQDELLLQEKLALRQMLTDCVDYASGSLEFADFDMTVIMEILNSIDKSDMPELVEYTKRLADSQECLKLIKLAFDIGNIKAKNEQELLNSYIIFQSIRNSSTATTELLKTYLVKWYTTDGHSIDANGFKNAIETTIKCIEAEDFDEFYNDYCISYRKSKDSEVKLEAGSKIASLFFEAGLEKGMQAVPVFGQIFSIVGGAVCIASEFYDSLNDIEKRQLNVSFYYASKRLAAATEDAITYFGDSLIQKPTFDNAVLYHNAIQKYKLINKINYDYGNAVLVSIKDNYFNFSSKSIETYLFGSWLTLIDGIRNVDKLAIALDIHENDLKRKTSLIMSKMILLEDLYSSDFEQKSMRIYCCGEDDPSSFTLSGDGNEYYDNVGIVIACPVNISIYSDTGELAAKIEGDKTEYMTNDKAITTMIMNEPDLNGQYSESKAKLLIIPCNYSCEMEGYASGTVSVYSLGRMNDFDDLDQKEMTCLCKNKSIKAKEKIEYRDNEIVKTSNKAAIIAVVVGIIVILLAVCILVIFAKRKGRARR